MLREFSGLGLDSENRCPSALAPMQDVTGLGFMRTIARGRLIFLLSFSGFMLIRN